MKGSEGFRRQVEGLQLRGSGLGLSCFKSLRSSSARVAEIFESGIRKLGGGLYEMVGGV